MTVTKQHVQDLREKLGKAEARARICFAGMMLAARIGTAGDFHNARVAWANAHADAGSLAGDLNRALEEAR